MAVQRDGSLMLARACRSWRMLPVKGWTAFCRTEGDGARQTSAGVQAVRVARAAGSGLTAQRWPLVAMRRGELGVGAHELCAC